MYAGKTREISLKNLVFYRYETTDRAPIITFRKLQPLA